MIRIFRGNKNFPFWFLAALVILGLLWMSLPAILGFTPGQMVRWGQIRNAPAVLDEWRMERTGGGRITITHEDGSRTVIETRNGGPVKTETYGADGGRTDADDGTIKRDWFNWKRLEAVWGGLCG